MTLNMNDLSSPVRRHGSRLDFKKQDPTFLLTLRNTPYSQRQITPQDGWGRCPKQKELGNKLV